MGNNVRFHNGENVETQREWRLSCQACVSSSVKRGLLKLLPAIFCVPLCGCVFER